MLKETELSGVAKYTIEILNQVQQSLFETCPLNYNQRRDFAPTRNLGEVDYKK